MCAAYQHYYVSEYTVIPAVKAIRAHCMLSKVLIITANTTYLFL